MRRKFAKPIQQDESGRDSRLKLILLAVALVLVAGYAASVTRMGDLVADQISEILNGGIPTTAIAGVAGAAIVIALAIFFGRRLRGRVRGKPAEAADAIVGLAGRREFLKTLTEHIDAHAKSGRQVAIHVIDIDRFSAVNDFLGEAEGDAFLRMVAERLLVLVNHHDRLARIGDDEFVVVQPEAGGARHAEIYARRIQETVKDACAQIPRHARPGASIGIAVYPEHGADAAKLMHSASLALHAAKKAGGECFLVYSREMDMAVEARLEMEKAISDGLHQGWFELHFQPQYDLLSRRLTGFEALVRMNHPQLGVLPPAAFLPAAEESGLIQPLGDWIIREALATAGEWPAHLVLSLNIALAQFRHGDIAGSIISMLSKSSVDGARLRVEISEAVLSEKSNMIAEQLQRLKSRGVTIVLDDFGIETSRLKALSRLACDAVKLDRTLIEQVGEEPEAENLVRSLIGAARSFDLDVQAEGIERAEQAHFLMSNDCQNVQGFLFGRPAHARDIAAIIAKDMRKAADGERQSPAPSRSAA
ncbi:MAG: putative bifunctional diguanylate cyclase/phosphodiesterase [Propylenella sp.]